MGLTGLVLAMLPAATLAAPGQAPVAGRGDAGEVIEEIVVTGSHLQRRDRDGPAPVSIFDAAELAAAGVNTLSEFAATCRRMPIPRPKPRPTRPALAAPLSSTCAAQASTPHCS